MDEDTTQNDSDIFAELAKAKSAPMHLNIEDEVDEAEDEPRHGEEGQLTIDVFQDEDNIYVQSAVAGVEADDLDVNITKEAVTIRGKREKSQQVKEDDYVYQECFWGSFSRSIVLPEEVDPDRSVASLKNGILTVKMPKFDHRRAKSLKVKSS